MNRRQILTTILSETVAVTYEPAVRTAVFYIALRALKNWYFIAKTGKFW